MISTAISNLSNTVAGAAASVSQAISNAKTKLYLMTHGVAQAKPFSGSYTSEKGGDWAAMDTIVNYLIGGIEVVGIVFIIMGAVSIATGIKSGEQNPEALTGAIKNIVVGVLLCCVGGIVALLAK